MRFSLSMFPVGGVGRPTPLAELIDEILRSGVEVRVRGGDALVRGERSDVEEAVARAQRRLASRRRRRFAVLLMETPGEGRAEAGTRRPAGERFFHPPSRN